MKKKKKRMSDKMNMRWEQGKKKTKQTKKKTSLQNKYTEMLATIATIATNYC